MRMQWKRSCKNVSQSEFLPKFPAADACRRTCPRCRRSLPMSRSLCSLSPGGDGPGRRKWKASCQASEPRPTGKRGRMAPNRGSHATDIVRHNLPSTARPAAEKSTLSGWWGTRCCNTDPDGQEPGQRVPTLQHKSTSEIDKNTPPVRMSHKPPI